MKQADFSLTILVSMSTILYFYYMSTIVVNPKNEKEFQFLFELLQKLNINAKVLSYEDFEDLGLFFLMKDIDRSDFCL